METHIRSNRLPPARPQEPDKETKEVFTYYLRSNLSNQQRTDNRVIILTVSASSTISNSILDAYAALENMGTLELRILESRPLFEGVSIASSLYSQFKYQFPPSSPSSQNKNLEIKLYTDASAALAATDVDLFLLGAD